MRKLFYLGLVFVLIGCAPTVFNGGCVDDSSFSFQFENGPEIEINATVKIGDWIAQPKEACTRHRSYGLTCKPKTFPFVIELKGVIGQLEAHTFDNRTPKSLPVFYHPNRHSCLRSNNG